LIPSFWILCVFPTWRGHSCGCVAPEVNFPFPQIFRSKGFFTRSAWGRVSFSPLRLVRCPDPKSPPPLDARRPSAHIGTILQYFPCLTPPEDCRGHAQGVCLGALTLSQAFFLHRTAPYIFSFCCVFREMRRPTNFSPRGPLVFFPPLLRLPFLNGIVSLFLFSACAMRACRSP